MVISYIHKSMRLRPYTAPPFAAATPRRNPCVKNSFDISTRRFDISPSISSYVFASIRSAANVLILSSLKFITPITAAENSLSMISFKHPVPLPPPAYFLHSAVSAYFFCSSINALSISSISSHLLYLRYSYFM